MSLPAGTWHMLNPVKLVRYMSKSSQMAGSVKEPAPLTNCVKAVLVTSLMCAELAFFFSIGGHKHCRSREVGQAEFAEHSVLHSETVRIPEGCHPSHY